MTAPQRESECTIYDIIVECSTALQPFEPSDAEDVAVDSSFGWPHPEPDEAHLDRLIVGQSYKQLLFYEECCSRGFAIAVEHIT